MCPINVALFPVGYWITQDYMKFPTLSLSHLIKLRDQWVEASRKDLFHGFFLSDNALGQTGFCNNSKNTLKKNHPYSDSQRFETKQFEIILTSHSIIHQVAPEPQLPLTLDIDSLILTLELGTLFFLLRWILSPLFKVKSIFFQQLLIVLMSCLHPLMFSMFTIHLEGT